MPGNDIVEVWLATKLVYPLSNLVTCGITKTREQRQQLRKYWFTCSIAEDDRRNCLERDLHARCWIRLQ